MNKDGSEYFVQNCTFSLESRGEGDGFASQIREGDQHRYTVGLAETEGSVSSRPVTRSWAKAHKGRLMFEVLAKQTR